MRVLHVISELRTGGAERVVISIMRGAASAGHEVAVAAGAGPWASEFPGQHYALPVLERRPHRIPLASWRLWQAIRRFQPNVVHCHNPGMAAMAAVPTRRGRHPPAIVSVHGVAPEDYPRAARVLRWSGLSVVACGPGVHAGLSEHRVRVLDTIVNGITPPSPPADRGALMLEWGLPDSLRLVVSVGRLVPQKNHALAVRAVDRIQGAALVILGAGPLRDELVGLAADLGAADRVVLPGPRSDARAVMAAADAVVLSSRWEGLPLVALEAIAAGTPLVATAVRGTKELLHDGSDCLLVTPDDPDALSAALRAVLDDESLACRLSEGGRKTAALYTEHAMVSRFLDLYESL